MTSIKLTVTGAEIRASVTGTLTSGMVGIPITIEYDKAWEGLTKNLVCRCSKSGSTDVEYRSILDVGNTAVVAHEVMQAGTHLYLGVEGFSPDGKLVIPTTWVMCGVIQKGANTGEDLSTDPTLPVWNQLQTQIEQLESNSIPQELLDEIQASVETAVEAASSAERSKKSASAASVLAVNSAESAEASADSARASMEDARTSVSSAAYLANETLRLQQAAEAAAERAENAADSLYNSTQGGGMNVAAKKALISVVESIGVFNVGNPQELIDNLRNALYDAPVAAVSAVYTQTRTVYATDSLEVLRDDLVVTAAYADGSSAVRTDYTLSGALSAGVSVITVALDGKTSTFEVQVAAARIPATDITLSSRSISITAGEPVQLVATVEPADSTDKVVWASSEEAVATVAQDGTVTPIANGACKIIATAGDARAECAVSVSLPLAGYNYGNPYLNYVSSAPTTLGKTDEELRGKWYDGRFNAWGNKLGVSGRQWFLYPFAPGTHYIRYVNRVPVNAVDLSFHAFSNADIVANPTATLGAVGADGSNSGASVTKIGIFDNCELNANDAYGRANIGKWTTADGSNTEIDEGFLMLFELTVPEGEYVFMSTTEAGNAKRVPGYSDRYPINDWYTIFADDPSGNILQIAGEVQA